MTAKEMALALVERSPILLLGTTGTDGAPEVKALLKTKNDGLRRFWFCSNTSSRRTTEIRRDSRACLYAYEFVPGDIPVCRGVMLSGTAALSYDDRLRKSFWQDFMTMYYPKGPSDPDFVVIEFTAARGNYYEGLKNTNFKV